MFTVTGGTYAYFAFSAKNENTITGTAATTGLNLLVERKLPTTVGVMVPQLESGLGSAISTTYSCIDGNNNTVCQVYKATITNNGTGSVELNGTIKFSDINNMPNLKWKRITDERTIGEYTSNKASTSNVIFDSNKVLAPNASETYYFVIWIDETGTTQTDSGTFRVTIEFNPANGDGLTSTIVPEDTQGTLASTYVINKYNDGSEITTVNIGGDTSKPQVNLNATQGIMLDNNGDYRYYGADPNNYVSYNDELWRIISVGNVKSSSTDTTGETRVKIVKADILTDDNGLKKYSWDSSASTVNSGWGVNDWSKSDLMTELNTLYLNSTSGDCYTGASNVTTACNFTNTGLSQEARNLTADALYYLGGSSTYSGIYPNDYYTFERGTAVWGSTSGQTCNDGACPRATTWTGRVGIIYPSDYAYATDLSVCTKDPYNYDTDNNCKNNDWLLDTSNYQWTISPYSSRDNLAFIVYSSGGVKDDHYVGGARGVRAVQYLRSEVTIVEGVGTSTNPYILGTL